MRKRLSRLPHNSQILLAILALSILLRLAAALYLGDTVEILPGTYDQISYHNLALRVLDGHGFTFGQQWWPITAANAPTAHWSYLYTFYLIVVYGLFGPHPLAARLIQALLVGLLQPLLVYLIAQRIFGQIVALVATALTTVYVYFIYYSATLMTEPFYITAILSALYLAILMADQAAASDLPKSRNTVFALAILLGLTLGITVLLRQLFLLIVPFLFLWIWWATRQRGGRWALPGLLLSGSMIVGMILPFTIDNYTRFGRFVLLNTNAGYAFFWSNHPIYGTHFPILPTQMGTYPSLIPAELRHLDEAALDQALLKRGLQFVIDDPIRYLRLSLSRIPAYFMFWPSPDSSLISNISRLSSFALFLPFMLYGLLLTFLSGHRSTPRKSKDLPTSNSFLSGRQSTWRKSKELTTPNSFLSGRQSMWRKSKEPPTSISFLSGRQSTWRKSKEQPQGPRPPDYSTTQPPTFHPSALPPSNPSPNPLAPPPLTPNPLSPASYIASPIFLLMLFASIYTLIHLLSWALIRYRLPVDAILLIFAALAIVNIAQRLGVTRWALRHAN